MPYITTLREATDAVADVIEDEMGPLGIHYVGRFDERKLPHYPAVVVSPGSRTKEIGGVSRFDIMFLVEIWVYHAQLTMSYVERNREDLMLIEGIERVLELDPTLGGKVVFGYIDNDQPGVIQANTRKSEIVVGTKMQWVAKTLRGFTDL